MTTKHFTEAFDEHEDEFLKFDRIPADERLSTRPDLHAFTILDRLVPGTDDMVSSAQYDEIFLSIDPETLASVVSREQLVDLIRCGLRYDEQFDSLAMFV